MGLAATNYVMLTRTHPQRAVAGFIQSIDELLRVRSNAQSLKDIISEMGLTATNSVHIVTTLVPR